MNKEIEHIGPGEAIIGDVLVVYDEQSSIYKHTIEASSRIVESTSPAPKENGSSNVAAWGEDNLFPQNVIERVEKDTEVAALLDWKGRVLQGREIVATIDVWDDLAKTFKAQRIQDEEVNKFLRSRMVKRYWREASVDFTWFHAFFPDLRKSKDGKKIASISTHEAAWCRWAKMNVNGVIDKCYVSAHWDTGSKPIDVEKFKNHPVVDPYSYSLVEDLRKAEKIKRFVFPSNYPSPDKPYYPSAPWTNFLFSKWFDIKTEIPEWKWKLMNRIFSASYIVTIPTTYWSAANKDWHTKTPAEQKKIKADKLKEINDKLTGKEGVGATILSEVGVDDRGQQIPQFVITPVPKISQEGMQLEDSQEASGHLNRSLNVDPTLVGTGPGRGKDAGSGSDKRVAFNIYTALLTPYREVMLEPIYFIAEYNGWVEKHPSLRFHVLEVELQTLDKGSTSKTTDPVGKIVEEEL